MKSQNPSLNFYFERTDGETNGQVESNMLPTFSKLGHKKILYQVKDTLRHF